MKKLLLTVVALLGVAAIHADTTTITNKSKNEVNVVCTESVDPKKRENYSRELDKGDRVMYDSGSTCRDFTVNGKSYSTGRYKTITIDDKKGIIAK